LSLLIDEMYPPAVADQLRRRGHDVTAVTERPELRALDDQEVFATTQQEHHAVVTENVVDFIPLADAVDQRGGTTMVWSSSVPPSTRGGQGALGHRVRALDCLLHDPPPGGPTGFRYWL
jgi:predicted nuclease of predicted toxin-antitoxin system